MEYMPHAKKLLRALFPEIRDQYWPEFEKELLEETGMTYEELSNKIEDGVNNGYSVEFQLKLVENIIKSSL